MNNFPQNVHMSSQSKRLVRISGSIYFQKSVEKYCKPGTTAEAWCLAYHNHYSKTLLVPEKQPKKLKENGKQVRAWASLIEFELYYYLN